jgi:2-methylisocitrate lyase-like PEP mutase family enzyme
MTVPSDRIDAFHRLHASGCFVMANPWDTGSARALAQLGFPALATTSAGFAWTMGRPDNGVTLKQTLAHLRTVSAAVGVPVNADFEGAYARDPDQVQANVTLAVTTGVAGLSVEDSTGNADGPLYPIDLAVDRIRAARRAIDESGTGVLINAPFLTVAEAAALGVRRISVGGTLARTAWARFLTAA